MTLLDPQDVTRRLGEIRAVAKEDDFEKAHELQDDLLKGVLELIASGYLYPARLAAAALQVYDIDFERWCA